MIWSRTFIRPVCLTLTHLTTILVLGLLVTAMVCPETRAQQAAKKRLIVGTRHAPPFAIHNEDGTWKGIVIELWRRIADELNLDYEFQERGLKELLTGLEDGTLDAAVASLTVTAEREERVDFTHPFYTSGLGIAVPGETTSGWANVVKRVASFDLIKVLVALAVLLLLVGFVVWIFERRRNVEQFGGAAGGIWSGFWWSAVTMTTVGYGDKAPRTVGGRVVALLWMFASILIISSFTAAIASALTISQLESGVRGPEDLPGLKIATVPGSTSETYLRRRRLVMRSYQSPLDGLNAVVAGEVDAEVYDAPILRYLTAQEIEKNVHVLPRTFETQNYAIGLRPNSELREDINRVLLKHIAEPWWQDTLYRYLGN